MYGDLKLKQEQKEIHRRTAPPGEVVYQAIYEEADHELGRDSAALTWSGVAAGLSMGFSMVVQAVLTVYLPEAHWRPLLTRLGYTAGFLIPILIGNIIGGVSLVAALAHAQFMAGGRGHDAD